MRRGKTRTLGDMSNRLPLALAAYLSLWAAIGAGIVYGTVQAGYSAWAGGMVAFLIFLFLNGSLAYRARVRQMRSEGKEPPRYLEYIFFPAGPPKAKEAAPRSTHFIAGAVAAAMGLFLLFCGVALAFSAQWSRISEPVLGAGICVVLSGIGALLLYFAWRCFTLVRKPANVA